MDHYYSYSDKWDLYFSVSPDMTVESELGRFIRFDGKKTMNDIFKDMDYGEALKKAC